MSESETMKKESWHTNILHHPPLLPSSLLIFLSSFSFFPHLRWAHGRFQQSARAPVWRNYPCCYLLFVLGYDTSVLLCFPFAPVCFSPFSVFSFAHLFYLHIFTILLELICHSSVTSQVWRPSAPSSSLLPTFTSHPHPLSLSPVLTLTPSHRCWCLRNLFHATCFLDGCSREKNRTNSQALSSCNVLTGNGVVWCERYRFSLLAPSSVSVFFCFFCYLCVCAVRLERFSVQSVFVCLACFLVFIALFVFCSLRSLFV